MLEWSFENFGQTFVLTRIRCFPPSLATQLRSDTTMLPPRLRVRQLPRLLTRSSVCQGDEEPSSLSSVPVCVCVRVSVLTPAGVCVLLPALTLPPLRSELSALWLFIPPKIKHVWAVSSLSVSASSSHLSPFHILRPAGVKCPAPPLTSRLETSLQQIQIRDTRGGQYTLLLSAARGSHRLTCTTEAAWKKNVCANSTCYQIWWFTTQMVQNQTSQNSFGPDSVIRPIYHVERWHLAGPLLFARSGPTKGAKSGPN